MLARKELIKKVADAIEGEGAKASSPYNYDKILDNFNLRSDMDKDRMNSIMICCPFHSDDDPSLSINFERRSWHCFGCERGGDTLQFLVELERVNGDAKCTRASKANSILREDPNIRGLTGINSVYARETSIKQFEPVPLKRKKYSTKVVPTLNSIADKIIKRGDYELVERGILMMQKGFTPEVIDESLFTVSTKKEYSIEEMWL